MMKLSFIRTALLLLSLTLIYSINPLITSAQKLEHTQPFEAGTPFLEPDGRREVLKLHDNTFVVVTKSKGAIAGDADGVIERYDAKLKNIFKTNFTIHDNEEIKEIYNVDNTIVLLVIVHDTELKVSSLMGYYFDINSGAQKENKKLFEYKINKWQTQQMKGSVKLTFENYVGSIIGQNYITPPEYQYEIKFSPDSNKILTYIYDYGQKNLLAHACVFDKNFNKITEGIIPIDNNFVNYGLYINDAGEIVILNGDRLGRIVVVEYNLETHVNKYLDIQYASAHRESLKLQIINNDIIYVANIVTSNAGKLLATMYSKFNFKTHKIDKINYHNISDSLNSVVKETRMAAKVHGDENWQNYELTNFYIDPSEKATLVLEKREIQSPAITYDHAGVLDVNKWIEGTGKVSAEGILVLCFDKKDKLLFENYCPKYQSADITSGLNSASYSMDLSSNGKLRIIYTTADNASGVFNTIHYMEWDENSGELQKNIKLENPEGMCLLRNYTVWYNDKLIVCGRKGFLGKKSFISTYTLE